MSLSTLRPRSD